MLIIRIINILILICDNFSFPDKFTKQPSRGIVFIIVPFYYLNLTVLIIIRITSCSIPNFNPFRIYYMVLRGIRWYLTIFIIGYRLPLTINQSFFTFYIHSVGIWDIHQDLIGRPLNLLKQLSFFWIFVDNALGWWWCRRLF